MFSFGKFKLVSVTIVQFVIIEVEPSEKNISKSLQVSLVIVSHSLYTFQLLSVATKILSSGL